MGTTRELMCVTALFVAAAVALPARAGEGQEENLKEAYYLALCARSQWEDAEAFKFLAEACGDSPRRAMYMWNRAGALQPQVLDMPFDGRSSPEELVARKEAFFREIQDLDKGMSASSGAFLAYATGVRSANEIERVTAAGGLCALSGDEAKEEEERIALLVILLNDPSYTVRAFAAAKGWTLHPPTASARRALPFLAVRVMLDSSDMVRRLAARSLGHLAGEEFGRWDGMPTHKTEKAGRKWIEEHCDLSALADEEAVGALLGPREPSGLVSLAEAYYLAKCAESGWRDGKWWNLVTSSVHDDALRAQCLLGRWKGCLAGAKEEPPAIQAGNWEREHEALAHSAEEAEQALRALHEEALFAWVTLMHSTPDWVRESAARQLGRFANRAEGVDALIMLMNDRNSLVRGKGASALAEGSEAGSNEVRRRALPFLALRALRDPDWLVRDECLDATLRLAGGAPEVPQMSAESRAWALEWIRGHYDLSLISAH